MRNASLQHLDITLVLCTLAASCVGVMMVYSATKSTHGPTLTLSDFAVRQAIYVIAGLVLLFVVSRLNYRFLESFTLPLYFVVLALLGAVMVIGKVSGGSQRWLLNNGIFAIQPSEIAKLMIIVVLAKLLSDHEKELDRIKWFVIAFAVTFIPAAVVFEQPDLGTSIMLPGIFLGMAVASGVRGRIFVGAALIAAPAVFVFWNWVMHDYQRARFLTFLNPEKDLLGDGYNILQSRITIGSGGLFGQGYLSGSQSQLGFQKVQYSDFIFSVVAEEFGLIGSLALIALLLMIVWRCLVVASRARDCYGSLIAIGVATWIGIQTFINVGMNIGLMPVTGIPLPFISYGGSSLMSMLVGLGLVQSVALRSTPVVFGGTTWSPGWARASRTTLRPR